MADIKESKSVSEAQTNQKWLEAMENEIGSLHNNVWEHIELPEDRKAVGSKWVFKLKTNANGSIERSKVRLVAWVFSPRRA